MATTKDSGGARSGNIEVSISATVKLWTLFCCCLSPCCSFLAVCCGCCDVPLLLLPHLTRTCASPLLPHASRHAPSQRLASPSLFPVAIGYSRIVRKRSECHFCEPMSDDPL
ncbi:hypothetical protein M3J09_006533 [Ascochyta lentis]